MEIGHNDRGVDFFYAVVAPIYRLVLNYKSEKTSIPNSDKHYDI